MLYLVMLIYLGIKVNVANWYFWICSILGFYKIIEFGYKLYKSGIKRGKEE